MGSARQSRSIRAFSSSSYFRAELEEELELDDAGPPPAPEEESKAALADELDPLPCAASSLALKTATA